MGVHISLAPTWFDPAETPGIITPFMVLYALHDALVKPMPGQPDGAEPGRVVDDVAGRARLRVRAAQGREVPQRRAAVTAEDVKFSFERYRGAAAKHAQGARGRASRRRSRSSVRFRLKQPWPDFMTFYARAPPAPAGSCPKKYVEKVGDDGFKKAPIGAGPYKFVSFTPGVELVLEAFERYWRKTPERQASGASRSIPDESTRLAALKRGEVDIVVLDPRAARRGDAAHAGAHAQARPSSRRRSGSYFADQWDPKSPVARPARAPGRQPRHRPAGHQPGRDARATRG